MEQAPEQLPPWGDDPLSVDLMSKAERNVRVTALNWPEVYEVLQKTHTLFKRLVELLEGDPGDPNLSAPRLLILRCNSAVLAGMRLAMSGQAVEARPVLRGAIESAWYALHIAKDPAPPKRAKLWWDRHARPAAKQACKNEFKVETVRATHEALDAKTAQVMQQLYADSIDFGGHPYERGVASSLGLDKSKLDEVTVSVAVLQPGRLPAAAALKAAVDVTIGAAKTVEPIYPERFRVMGVDREVDQLARDAGTVFGKHAQALQSGQGSVA